MKAIDYFYEHEKDFVNQLGALVAFKSISTDPKYKDEVLAAASWVKTKLESLGFGVQEVKTTSNPILLASRKESDNAPTVLLYGHYDVQPVDPVSDWLSDPFTLSQREGKYYGRGIMDNKGQLMMHISSIDALLNADGKLPINIKFIIEGDEETGSGELGEVTNQYADFLKADFALISDGDIIGDTTPVIEASFRGVINTELTIFGPKEDIHSGIAGGAIANPAYELVKLLSKLYDSEYTVTIPGFYDDVIPINSAEKQAVAQKSGTDEDFLKLTGSPGLQGESGYNRFEQTGLRPTLQITGLFSGYTGVGYKNIVPARASAKLNFRLVVNQDPQKVSSALKEFIAANLPASVTWTLDVADTVRAVKVDIHNPYMRQASDTLSSLFGKAPEVNFVGGTLPVVNAIKEYLQIPILSIPLAQEDCGMHAPNERLTEEAFRRGVQFSIEFLSSVKKPR